MPWFRFTGDARVTLRFRDAECELTFAVLGGAEPWTWVAQRKNNPQHHVVLVRSGNVLGLRVLMEDGFDVPAASPAEKVMQAAVKSGFAEALPDEKRSRQELVRAKRARTR